MQQQHQQQSQPQSKSLASQLLHELSTYKHGKIDFAYQNFLNIVKLVLDSNPNQFIPITIVVLSPKNNALKQLEYHITQTNNVTVATELNQYLIGLLIRLNHELYINQTILQGYPVLQQTLTSLGIQINNKPINTNNNNPSISAVPTLITASTAPAPAPAAPISTPATAAPPLSSTTTAPPSEQQLAALAQLLAQFRSNPNAATAAATNTALIPPPTAPLTSHPNYPIYQQQQQQQQPNNYPYPIPINQQSGSHIPVYQQHPNSIESTLRFYPTSMPQLNSSNSTNNQSIPDRNSRQRTRSKSPNNGSNSHNNNSRSRSPFSHNPSNSSNNPNPESGVCLFWLNEGKCADSTCILLHVVRTAANKMATDIYCPFHNRIEFSNPNKPKPRHGGEFNLDCKNPHCKQRHQSVKFKYLPDQQLCTEFRELNQNNPHSTNTTTATAASNPRTDNRTAADKLSQYAIVAEPGQIAHSKVACLYFLRTGNCSHPGKYSSCQLNHSPGINNPINKSKCRNICAYYNRGLCFYKQFGCHDASKCNNIHQQVIVCNDGINIELVGEDNRPNIKK